ncbi:MAG: hypothetical protein ACOYUZ_03525 [Patescibacteria group bacterium]
MPNPAEAMPQSQEDKVDLREIMGGTGTEKNAAEGFEKELKILREKEVELNDQLERVIDFINTSEPAGKPSLEASPLRPAEVPTEADVERHAADIEAQKENMRQAITELVDARNQIKIRKNLLELRSRQIELSESFDSYIENINQSSPVQQVVDLGDPMKLNLRAWYTEAEIAEHEENKQKMLERFRVIADQLKNVNQAIGEATSQLEDVDVDAVIHKTRDNLRYIRPGGALEQAA